MRIPVRFAAVVIALVAAVPAFAAPPDFARDVWPVLKRSCVDCHGQDKQKGALRLDSRAAALKGGDTGPAIVPGKPDESELIRRIVLAKDDDAAMPARGERLTPAEIEHLRGWVAAGAPWPADATVKHWAYVKPTRQTPPVVRAADWIKSPIDRFVLARLDAAGLAASPEADRYTLARRVTLDLTGLPPTTAEVDAFVNDPSPDGYERLVDRLLASPAFGERWARPWLDLARYADSHGFQRDDLREVWPFRDWVIRALNADMPFDQFTIEQLAGDLLPNATQDQKIATGFHRCTPTNVEAGSEPEETRVNQVFDRVNTTAAVWLGTTLECAQCHDHKYDPFPQRDYYRLFAIFNNTEAEAARAKANVPGSIRFLGPRLELSGYAKAEPLDPGNVSDDDDDDAARPRKAAPATPRTPTTLVMRELPKPRETHVFARGDYRALGEKVEPGIPAACGYAGDAQPQAANRLDLARWLVSPDNPLTARVTVNRWWADLFGRGLVATPEDFGLRGEPPTHPELLDWLACELVEDGWSMKRLLRTVVTSATYRQSSRVTPELLARDPENKVLARGPRFRLDAEAVRDNALAAAGLLSRSAFGPPVRPLQPAGLWTKVGGVRVNYDVSPPGDRHRRGVYVVWKRGSPYPGLMTFDAAARLTCTVHRPRTNTPLQALTLLNDPVYVEAALALARRAVTEAPDVDGRIRHTVRLSLARPPREAEVRILRDLFEQQLAAGRAELEKVKALVKGASPAGCPPEEFAAWYAVAAAVLNLDETITKE